nr:MAG TPA: ParB-like nuclease domain [Caudoviricetes sp.]
MNQKIEMVEVDALHFDPLNPRFSSLDFNKEDEQAVVDLMIREESLMDLVLSIGDHGFFQGEPLLAYRGEDGRLIVAEGNRRLAAVKVLLNPKLTTLPSFHEAVEQAKHKPHEVPCLIFNTRNDTLGYLGFKHITGNKKWGALEKAVYLSQLRDFTAQQQPGLSQREMHRLLARQVGSQGPTIGRTLTAYAVYLRGNKQGREKLFFDLQGVDQSQVDFSLVYTALSYENIYAFLGLSSSTDATLNGFDDERGKDLFRWLFKQNDYGQTVVSESRKLKELNKVLGSKDACHYFQETNNLDAAYRLSAGPLDAFEGLIQTLQQNERQLTILFGKLRSDILDNRTTSQFTNTHVVALSDLGRAFRILSGDIEEFINKQNSNRG